MSVYGIDASTGALTPIQWVTIHGGYTPGVDCYQRLTETRLMMQTLHHRLALG